MKQHWEEAHANMNLPDVFDIGDKERQYMAKVIAAMDKAANRQLQPSSTQQTPSQSERSRKANTPHQASQPNKRPRTGS